MRSPLNASASVKVPAPVAPLFDKANASMLLRIVRQVTWLERFDRFYDKVNGDEHNCPWAALLTGLNVRFDAQAEDLARIPRERGLVVVANHPYGIIDAIIMVVLLKRVRPDVRVVANSVLSLYPELARDLILVNAFGGAEARRENSGGIRESLAWLKAGGLLMVFPAGEVSSFDWRKRCVTDSAWSTKVVRLAAKAQVPVLPIYFAGRNPVSFHAAGCIHPRARTALLVRNFFNKAGKTLDVRVGSPVGIKKLTSLGSDEDRIDYLRRKTYLLATRGKPASIFPELWEPLAERWSRKAHTQLAPIIGPSNASVMEAEIQALPADHLLAEQGDNLVYVAAAQKIPHVVREIGRLREITFRQAGEGTGHPVDLDNFDSYYLHLFIWNRSAREVVGAYRLGQTDRILQSYGREGLYTSTLFAYKRAFIEQINPALEMGRSFVRIEYQKSYTPLLLLWRGIGAYVSRHPHYRVLFGPVSISGHYHPSSRQLIVSFLKEYCSAKDLARLVRARSPFRTRPIRGWEGKPDNSTAWDIEDLSALIADIETDQKGVPVLLRQYLRLGGKLLGFNVDAKFSNALDGLIVVDLLKTDSPLLERYMTAAGARAFTAWHRSAWAQVR